MIVELKAKKIKEQPTIDQIKHEELQHSNPFTIKYFPQLKEMS